MSSRPGGAPHGPFAAAHHAQNHYVYPNPTCDWIDGEIRHYDDPQRLPDQCFTGLNATNCTYTENVDKPPLCARVCSGKPTLNGINGQKIRRRRKVTCGAHNNEKMDTSEFFLMTPRGLPSNLYGYEFRFRRKHHELDDTIIKCPLRRTACEYTGHYLLGCQAALDDS